MIWTNIANDSSSGIFFKRKKKFLSITIYEEGLKKMTQTCSNNKPQINALP